MSKRKNNPQRPASGPGTRWWITAVFAAVIAVATVAILNTGGKPTPPASDTTFAPSPATNAVPAPVAAPTADTNALPTMVAAQSEVLVKDLGFGPQAPVLEDVLRDIERRSQPDDGRGRTFAILEAFTQPDPVTAKLNLCLRISSEKPGIGEIVYRRTGEVLWKKRIVAATNKPAFDAGALRVLFDNGEGKTFNVDGSAGPPTIFDATLKELGVKVDPVWPEGAVRDMIFIYSACGCPIHVKCRREGFRTVRTEQATQVIFPDDPAAVQVISRLMGW